MSRTSPLSKFLPLAAIAAVQLLVILLVPSVGQTATSGLAADGGFGAPGVGSGAIGAPGAAGAPGTVAPDGTVIAGAPGSVAGGGVAGSSGGSVGGSGGGGGSAAAPGTSGQPPAVAGSTKHCVGGRQFDPKIDYYAPPCVPGVPGAAFANNGGATWQGVSKDTIQIVQYIPDYGAAVNTILQAQGLYYTATEAQVLDEALAKFINDHYQLYGRKIKVNTFQGKCATVPPDLKCLIPEMGEMVQKYKPYAVVFSTTVCSKCFAELARLKVVTTGGSGFSDEFHNANAPYSYDLSMSSTKISLQFADWWCNQMSSTGGTKRTAIFAGTKNPAQNFRNTPRQLGVVSTNDPDNQATVENVLYPALKKGCNDSVNGHEYFYAQDISTAQTQSQAGTSAMNTRQQPGHQRPVPVRPGRAAVLLQRGRAEQVLPGVAHRDEPVDGLRLGRADATSTRTGRAPWPAPTRRAARSTTGSGIGAADPQTSPARDGRCPDLQDATARRRCRCSRRPRTSSGATSTCWPA